MDERRFDNWTRRLAADSSRRGFVKMLAGGVAGALLHLFDRESAEAASGSLLRGRALPAAALSSDCAGAELYQRCGGCGNCAPTGRKSFFGRDLLGCRANHVFCIPSSSTDDSCPACDPATLTCTAGRKCGPCEKCYGNTGCYYERTGRDGQCVDPATAPCMRATGKCGCDDPLIFCDPDCVDPKSDRKHCGRCNKPCGRCEKCLAGRCVRCDRGCERCNDKGDCESTCTSPCFTVCQGGKCIEPTPKICVCEGQDDGGPPTAKRILLPVVAAQGEDTAGAKPCGEGDAQQCCAPEACCGEGARARCCAPGQECCAGLCKDNCEECPEHLICGDACCVQGEFCTSDGCCPLANRCPNAGFPPEGIAGVLCCAGPGLCGGPDVAVALCCGAGEEICRNGCCPSGTICDGSCANELGEGVGCCHVPNDAGFCADAGCSAPVPGRTAGG